MLRWVGFGFWALVLLGAGPATLQYPTAPSDHTFDTYYGTRVSDPYRPLENASNPAVKAWAAAETKLATDYIQSQPSYAFYAKRVAQLENALGANTQLHIAGGRFFYLQWAPKAQQAKLVVRDRMDGPERVLVDPQTQEQDGVQPSIESWFVAPDGSKVAFSTQYSGTENETLHVVDATTGQVSDDIVHVGGGLSPTAVAWDAGGNGFIHTVWPRNADGSYATSSILIYHHVLGTDPSSDTYVFGRGLSPKAEYQLIGSADGRTQALFETDGDGVHGSIYERHGSGAFELVAKPDAAIGGSNNLPAAFVGDDLYVVSKKNSSFGEVLAIVPGQTIASARTIVPPTNVVIQNVVAVPGGFITDDVDGGDSAARLFAPDGSLRARVPIPPVSVNSFASTDPVRGPVLFSYQSYATAATRVVYDAASNSIRPAPITAETGATDDSNVVTDRVLVPSLDGKVQIPLEIVHEKGTPMDGSAPSILYAYGAYGTITFPYYDPGLLAWLERGGVFAQAMIRGGGEYGDAWHKAAHLATKTVSSDDLAACADWLAAHGYGNAKHLGIWGGSAGGFLMGLALTRNPQRYRAVVSEVGIYDLLRIELTPNGAYNTPEFGTVKDPAQFAWMLKQSPYHNVVAGRAYPAILMTTGENDPRVNPYNSRKMIAQLQASSSSGYPVLLIQRSGQGHGIGEDIDEYTQNLVTAYTFFESQLR